MHDSQIEEYINDKIKRLGNLDALASPTFREKSTRQWILALSNRYTQLVSMISNMKCTVLESPDDILLLKFNYKCTVNNTTAINNGSYYNIGSTGRVIPIILEYLLTDNMSTDKCIPDRVFSFIGDNGESIPEAGDTYKEVSGTLTIEQDRTEWLRFIKYRIA